MARRKSRNPLAAAEKAYGTREGPKSPMSTNRSKDAGGKTYKGKSTKPGGGGAFAQMEAEVAANLEKKGMLTKKAKAIGAAVAAKRGRAKYGAKKMAKWAAAGRKRAAAKRKRKTSKPVGNSKSLHRPQLQSPKRSGAGGQLFEIGSFQAARPYPASTR